MVVDRTELTSNLTKFYDFRGKTVLYVGSGRGQLLGPAARPGKVVAIDKDEKSLDGFRREAKTVWKGIPIRFVPRRFESVRLKGDVVYFEFCFYQMDDPEEALAHARSLAPDVVVMDHLPGSKWIYYWEGEDMVRKSTAVAEKSGVKRRRRFVADQRFPDYAAFAERLSEGGEALPRVAELKGEKDIHIPMKCGLFLL